MTIETTRRAILAGVPAAAIAATIPASAVAAPADRRAWEHALARLAVADAEYEDYAANFHDPAYRAEVAFEQAHGAVHRLPDGGWNPTYWDARRKLEAEHGTAHRIPDHIGDRMDALGTAFSEAQGEVMQTPAPDLAALRWKIDHITDEAKAEDGSLPCYAASYVKQTLADIARLLPEGR